MKIFPTPHDSVFRKFFSDVSVAKDFLQLHLPPALRDMCDFRTLVVTSGAFVEHNLRPLFSDILYRLQTTAGAGYIYCVIEHQSSADKMMAFRMLRYCLLAMQFHLEQGNKELPLVIPLLFYHGPRSPYPHRTRWLDCFPDPAMAQALYTQAFPLVDVTVIPDEEIKTHRKAALLEYVQKHIRERDINLRQQDITQLLESAQPSKEQVLCLLHYLSQVANTLDSEAFFRNLAEKISCYKEEIMTIAEHMEQVGRNRGLQEVARNMLILGLDRDTIVRVTGLSDAEIDALADSAA